MPCYHPNRAFQLPDKTIRVVGKRGSRVPPGSRALELPCGQCIGCRLERARVWAIRCMHEASLYRHNHFITLTYDDQHLPRDLSLNHYHFELFMKRLRRRFFASNDMPIRYYMCGEYGEGRGRPHYHACLFNLHLPDKLYFKKTGAGTLYTSHLINELWGMGFSLIGDVTFESASYVARYCTEKITGPNALRHYELHDKTTGEIFQRVAEYNQMSLKPGIGAPWLHKYLRDVYPKGEVLVKGRFGKPPRYYDTIFRRDYDSNDEQYNLIRQKRTDQAILQQADNTRARRLVKEQVALARSQVKRKTLK